MRSGRYPKGQIRARFLYLFSFLVLSSVTAFGQTDVAITPTKSPIFFIGAENPVSVTAAKGTDENTTVSIRGGEGKITKKEKGLYSVQVASVTDACTIEVYVTGKLAGSSTFKVQPLPTPAATIGGYRSGDTIPAASFRQQSGVGLYLKNFPLPVRYEVVSFTLRVDDSKGNVVAAASRGSLFSDEAKQFISLYVKPGKIVTIDELRARDQSGREHALPSLLYPIQ